ncbi:hypothetical protein BaRGS_00015643 [Batillaria attramentaria]|uniref:RING-type domain-containing protein n=1 Tax=Batillaria attramentaria TaxID=370345 RepID=A0ABD0L225_9CAEN
MAVPEFPVQTATLTSSQMLRQLNVIVRPPPPTQNPRYSVEEQSGTDGDVDVHQPPNWSVVVRPLTRFLPNTTNNPALDLAHVGYRLATLSALPPSVPVSRVKLADAGFYYRRGRGDELICYTCQKRHSGTTSSRTTVTSTVSSPSASSTTAAASPPASCDSQNGARPEGGVGSIAPDEESQSQRVARLQAENRELARRLRCKVCLSEPIDTILVPCGHLVVCETCARNVTQCPLCRERIRATAKVHMS